MAIRSNQTPTFGNIPLNVSGNAPDWGYVENQAFVAIIRRIIANEGNIADNTYRIGNLSTLIENMTLIGSVAWSETGDFADVTSPTQDELNARWILSFPSTSEPPLTTGIPPMSGDMIVNIDYNNQLWMWNAGSTVFNNNTSAGGTGNQVWGTTGAWYDTGLTWTEVVAQIRRTAFTTNWTATELNEDTIDRDDPEDPATQTLLTNILNWWIQLQAGTENPPTTLVDTSTFLTGDAIVITQMNYDLWKWNGASWYLVNRLPYSQGSENQINVADGTGFWNATTIIVNPVNNNITLNATPADTNSALVVRPQGLLFRNIVASQPYDNSFIIGTNTSMLWTEAAGTNTPINQNRISWFPNANSTNWDTYLGDIGINSERGSTLSFHCAYGAEIVSSGRNNTPLRLRLRDSLAENFNVFRTTSAAPENQTPNMANTFGTNRNILTIPESRQYAGTVGWGQNTNFMTAVPIDQVQPQEVVTKGFCDRVYIRQGDTISWGQITLPTGGIPITSITPNTSSQGNNTLNASVTGGTWVDTGIWYIREQFTPPGTTTLLDGQRVLTLRDTAQGTNPTSFAQQVVSSYGINGFRASSITDPTPLYPSGQATGVSTAYTLRAGGAQATLLGGQFDSLYAGGGGSSFHGLAYQNPADTFGGLTTQTRMRLNDKGIFFRTSQAISLTDPNDPTVVGFRISHLANTSATTNNQNRMLVVGNLSSVSTVEGEVDGNNEPIATQHTQGRFLRNGQLNTNPQENECVTREWVYNYVTSMLGSSGTGDDNYSDTIYTETYAMDLSIVNITNIQTVINLGRQSKTLNDSSSLALTNFHVVEPHTVYNAYSISVHFSSGLPAVEIALITIDINNNIVDTQILRQIAQGAFSDNFKFVFNNLLSSIQAQNNRFYLRFTVINSQATNISVNCIFSNTVLPNSNTMALNVQTQTALASLQSISGFVPKLFVGTSIWGIFALPTINIGLNWNPRRITITENGLTSTTFSIRRNNSVFSMSSNANQNLILNVYINIDVGQGTLAMTWTPTFSIALPITQSNIQSTVTFNYNYNLGDTVFFMVGNANSNIGWTNPTISSIFLSSITIM